MAIEGPLKELGLHDVFQLLDLGRKTGVLRVTSHLRNNEGLVAFERGAVVWAEIRSNPIRLGELLIRNGRLSEPDLKRALAMMEKEGGGRRLGEVTVAMGTITERELRRLVDRQVTEVVFELLSWQEGFFSFIEGPLGDVPADAAVRIPIGSVLMEGARRIDEWSRIEPHLPHLGVVPELAPPSPDESEASRLDLLPDEWEVLTLADGSRDVRGIAQALERPEFEVARTLVGLASSSVVLLRDPRAERRSSATAGADGEVLLAAAQARLEGGEVPAAIEAAQAARDAIPGDARIHALLANAHLRAGSVGDAVEEGRRAVRLDPDAAEARRWLALALTAAGRFDEAEEQFGQWERTASAADQRTRAEMASTRAAVSTLARALGGRRA